MVALFVVNSVMKPVFSYAPLFSECSDMPLFISNWKKKQNTNACQNISRTPKTPSTPVG